MIDHFQRDYAIVIVPLVTHLARVGVTLKGNGCRQGAFLRAAREGEVAR